MGVGVGVGVGVPVGVAVVSGIGVLAYALSKNTVGLASGAASAIPPVRPFNSYNVIQDSIPTNGFSNAHQAFQSLSQQSPAIKINLQEHSELCTMFNTRTLINQRAPPLFTNQNSNLFTPSSLDPSKVQPKISKWDNFCN